MYEADFYSIYYSYSYYSVIFHFVVMEFSQYTVHLVAVPSVHHHEVSPSCSILLCNVCIEYTACTLGKPQQFIKFMQKHDAQMKKSH